VVATDADLPVQTVTYSISGGADAAKFTITSGGTVSFISPPNYEAPGDVGGDNVYNLQIQASDGAGGITVQNVAVAVGDVDEALGQVFVSGRVLMILGTNDPDHVVVNTEGNGTLKIHADFLPTNFVSFPLASVDRIEARLFGGDDQMTIAGNVVLPALMDGGGGNDQLNAGGGPTILLGGEGSDQLSGGSANSLLIGGIGADRLNGGSGDDLLIGGTTAYDSNDTALLAILSEWKSSRSYDARVANIRGTGTGPRLNGAYFLTKGTGATVLDDVDIDKATGAAGDDWFLFDLTREIATDRKTKEQFN
jgi:Ca2+-binding RTX toxin-like protein